MLEIIFGTPLSPGLMAEAIANLKQASVDGTLYLGYPVLGTIEDHLVIDGMLVSPNCPLTVILGPGTTHSIEAERLRQDEAYLAIRNHLQKFRELRNGRELAIELKVLTLTSTTETETDDANVCLVTPEQLPKILETRQPVEPTLLRHLHAILQRIATLRPKKKRLSVKDQSSKGAIIRRLELQIANLDQFQKRAAIESPDGPQRIRGLAGTGKTVVLALKAAYLHARHPEWKIGMTFFTRALYQQMNKFIFAFFRETSDQEPDFDMLRVIHAWGGASHEGLYTIFAESIGHTVRDFSYAKSVFGYNNAFKGVCDELLAAVNTNPPEPIFDAILVDEAQDMPPSFFQLVYAFTKPPYRIIWAYDELQNLSNAEGLPRIDKLFGTNEDGSARVTISNVEGEPRQDVILPICYRNTPWILTAAHALGFGIYRQKSLIQHFDDPALWEQIGYEVIEGILEKGSSVTLKRSNASTPTFFQEELKANESIQLHAFASDTEQDNWIASQIKKNITEDELEADDIVVIIPRALVAKGPSLRMQRALERMDIRSHIVGKTVSADEMFISGSVAITHSFRAKGNEAPMVYVAEAHDCAAGTDLSILRNMLFACMTRSRAWLRVVGYGPLMQLLKDEFEQTVANDFALKFNIPTDQEMKKLRSIHRDMPEKERKKISRKQETAIRQLTELLEADIPAELLDPRLMQLVDRLRKKTDEL